MPGATTGDAPLLTLRDLCERLQVSPRFVYRRTEKGSADPIPHLRVGGVLRFRASAINAWLAERESA